MRVIKNLEGEYPIVYPSTQIVVPSDSFDILSLTSTRINDS